MYDPFYLRHSNLGLALMPSLLLAVAVVMARLPLREAQVWRYFYWLSGAGLLATMAGLFSQLLKTNASGAVPYAWLVQTQPGAWVALLVQLLGMVIGVFSARYLQGESAQQRYVAALSAVLAAVHVLLLANHWVILITAWAVVGLALQTLLCFYTDRPFALLAAHKKRIADRIADALLLAAAAIAWFEVGSGSFSDLRDHFVVHEASWALQLGAVCLVLAVILRSALLPVHGWLIQVMEAPTPVSALLHAGVVNLGAFVLIQLSVLVETSVLARGVLVVFGLATATLGGMVMLTRVSIKVRLAWSTVAQMGFMLMQCGLGLYTLALLHLLGHSLYKAHGFLASSSAVRETRRQIMHGPMAIAPLSLLWAPLTSCLVIFAVQALLSAFMISGFAPWPWWWSALLGLAWAPLLWQAGPALAAMSIRARQSVVGLALVIALSMLASLAHTLPLGTRDVHDPSHGLGSLALAGMVWLYFCLALLQLKPRKLETWRRWSYAGFYVDEFYTRLTLRLFPAAWASAGTLRAPASLSAQSSTATTPK